MRYTAELLSAQLANCYRQHGVTVDDLGEKCIERHAASILTHARICTGAQFFYAIATGIDDAVHDGKLPKLPLIKKLAESYNATGDSLEPTRPGKKSA